MIAAFVFIERFVLNNITFLTVILKAFIFVTKKEKRYVT